MAMDFLSNALKGVNAMSTAGREKAALNALDGPGAVSTSGSTAVGSKGILSDIIKSPLVKTAVGVASNFLPGPLGAIVRTISGNDPEWWQSVKGDEITLNDPLRVIDTETPTFAAYQIKRALHPRYAIAEFLVWRKSKVDSSDTPYREAVCKVITPNTNTITQYLMPKIREVINAVVLQEADDYGVVLENQATIYAIWQQLKKLDYMLKHGTTYIQSLNDEAFPVFQTKNAAYLQSTINRLEEYLRAYVRLPHTLCEYLAWRFGRIYKSNDSAKAGLILYNVLPLTAETEVYDQVIQELMDQISSTPGMQKAASDLYNTYKDHEYKVEIKDDTQFFYDRKEFALRCNLTGFITAYDGYFMYPLPSSIEADVKAGKMRVDNPAQPIMLDSTCDNKTLFMASTVSSMGLERASQEPDVLFPVCQAVRCYIPSVWFDGTDYNDGSTPPRAVTQNDGGTFVSEGGVLFEKAKRTALHSSDPTLMRTVAATNTNWSYIQFGMDHVYCQINVGNKFGSDWLGAMAACKALDLYNMGIFFPVSNSGASGVQLANLTLCSAIDITTLSIDEGQPTMTTLETEHVYAFANLVEMSRKRSESLKEAEKELAHDVADVIEKIDVATPVAAVKPVSNAK
jgi:hypothetical protein